MCEDDDKIGRRLGQREVPRRRRNLQVIRRSRIAAMCSQWDEDDRCEGHPGAGDDELQKNSRACQKFKMKKLL